MCDRCLALHDVPAYHISHRQMQRQPGQPKAKWQQALHGAVHDRPQPVPQSTTYRVQGQPRGCGTQQAPGGACATDALRYTTFPPATSHNHNQTRATVCCPQVKVAALLEALRGAVHDRPQPVSQSTTYRVLAKPGGCGTQQAPGGACATDALRYTTFPPAKSVNHNQTRATVCCPQGKVAALLEALHGAVIHGYHRATKHHMKGAGTASRLCGIQQAPGGACVTDALRDMMFQPATSTSHNQKHRISRAQTSTQPQQHS
jgi:hypothetical protein